MPVFPCGSALAPPAPVVPAAAGAAGAARRAGAAVRRRAGTPPRRRRTCPDAAGGARRAAAAAGAACRPRRPSRSRRPRSRRPPLPEQAIGSSHDLPRRHFTPGKSSGLSVYPSIRRARPTTCRPRVAAARADSPARRRHAGCCTYGPDARDADCRPCPRPGGGVRRRLRRRDPAGTARRRAEGSRQPVWLGARPRLRRMHAASRSVFAGLGAGARRVVQRKRGSGRGESRSAVAGGAGAPSRVQPRCARLSRPRRRTLRRTRTSCTNISTRAASRRRRRSMTSSSRRPRRS